MESLVSYGSDDEQDQDNNTMGRRSDHRDGAASTTSRDNYETVGMEMSDEESNNNSPPPPAPSSRRNDGRYTRSDRSPPSKPRRSCSTTPPKPRLKERSRSRDRNYKSRDDRSLRDYKRRSRTPSRPDRKRERSPYDRRRSSKDRNSRERNYRDRGSRERTSPDRRSRERSSRDRVSRERSSRDRVSRERNSRVSKDRSSRDRVSRERSSRDRRRSSSRDRYRKSRSPKYSKRRSKSRERESRSSRSPQRFKNRHERTNNKLAVLEKLGIDIKGPTNFVTPQMLMQRTMTDKIEEVKKSTGIELPKYYNPAVMNPSRYAEQIQKRRLLWGNKGATAEQTKSVETVAASSSTSTTPAVPKIWQQTKFVHDNDGKVASKFKRLMGIKDDTPVTKEVTSTEVMKKQEEMFHSMEAQYEVARAATHTMRGVGLGFGAFTGNFPR